MTVGKVYLVGAGPGDPDLVTVKAWRLVQQADVIVYDRLIPRELLAEARFDTECIDVGKRPHQPSVTQDEINAILVERAQRGLQVVRLKGGDPFVFGRGGEEALACAAAGVPFEVVPGVSSAIAVPAYAGVPVTHRQLTQAFTVFTGHVAPDAEGSMVDYTALAAAARLGTVVLLMGVTHLPAISARLIEHGIDPTTPVVCIEWGTTPQQRTVQATLATIADVLAEAGLQPPVTTVIGAVVDLRAQGLDWFGS